MRIKIVVDKITTYPLLYRSHISSPTQLLMGAPVDVRPGLGLDGTPPHMQQPPQQPEITSVMEADRSVLQINIDLYFHCE